MDPATMLALANIAAQVLPHLMGGGQEKEKREYIPNQTPGQEELQGEAENAAKGTLGISSDYYKNLLNPNSQAFKQFAAPQIRQYNEDIVPGISEQFAGMGAGGLSSSGFRNAQIQGATDLSERLGAIRANLQMAGAQGLQGIHSAAMQPVGEYQTTQQGSPGMWGGIGEAAGKSAPWAWEQVGKWANNKWGQPGGTNTGANTPTYTPQWHNVPASPGGY